MKGRYALSTVGVPIIILLLAVLMGVLLQNDLFLDFWMSLWVLTWFVPIAVLITIVGVIWWMVRRRVGRGFLLIVIIAWSLVLAVHVFMDTGQFINSWKLDAVERYVARAVPILDEIKAKSGSYPITLPIVSVGEPPSLLRDYGTYSSDGKSFQFEYDDEPVEWAGGDGPQEYNSFDRKWEDEQ